MYGKLDSKEKLIAQLLNFEILLKTEAILYIILCHAYCDNFNFHNISHINYAWLSRQV